jgi:hypothetical protein
MKNMKNMLVTLGLFLTLSVSGMSNETSSTQATPVETVTINKADLTPDQLAKLAVDQKTAEITSNVQTASQWAGMGKEIGISIKEGLGAASDGVNNFAATPPGKLTMFLIAWKVMYKDVLETAKTLSGIFIGVPLLIFFDACLMTVLFKSIRPRKVLVSSEGWFKKKTYEYEDTWFTALNNGGEKPFTLGFFFAFCFAVNAIMLGAVIFRP